MESDFNCDLHDDNGTSATEACCSCGGGTRFNPLPSISPSCRPTQTPSSSHVPSVSNSPSTSFATIEQRVLLVDFYNSTNGDKWNKNDNWLGTTVSECD